MVNSLLPLWTRLINVAVLAMPNLSRHRPLGDHRATAVFVAACDQEATTESRESRVIRKSSRACGSS
ncbi:uncharacterized protein J3R85_018698 [Psidium guajava]|nr:uncharacterized protein J3R85_018698 [Psidium guajava]